MSDERCYLKELDSDLDTLRAQGFTQVAFFTCDGRDAAVPELAKQAHEHVEAIKLGRRRDATKLGL